MGWSIGFDNNWNRDIGYGVPAYCDHPGCGEEIDRGIAHVCGGEPYGGDYGCGLYFCSQHLYLASYRPQLCAQCRAGMEPFVPTLDHPDWVNHKLTDPSWQQWRDENPTEVVKLKIPQSRSLYNQRIIDRFTAEHIFDWDYPGIKVFKLNDYDFYAGLNLEGCIKVYIEETGLPRDDAIDDPHELSDEDMQKCRFWTDESMTATITFRQYLTGLILDGNKFPDFFASSEC